MRSGLRGGEAGKAGGVSLFGFQERCGEGTNRGGAKVAEERGEEGCAG